MQDLKIVIPAKIELGFQDRGKNPLGFATFYEGKKLRKEKSWNDWRDQKVSPKTYDNVPRAGFKVHEIDKRSSEWFGSGRTMWRILDPYGFQLEITSDNMLALLGSCNIIDGTFSEKLIWAWSGVQMSLLSENSHIYQEAVRNTNRINKEKLKPEDVKLGSRVLTKKGDDVIYLGCYFGLIVDRAKGVKVSKIYMFNENKSKGAYYKTLCTSSFDAVEIKVEGNLTAEEAHKIASAQRFVTGDGKSVMGVFNEAPNLKECLVKELINLEDYKKFRDNKPSIKPYGESKEFHAWVDDIKTINSEATPIIIKYRANWYRHSDETNFYVNSDNYLVDKNDEKSLTISHYYDYRGYGHRDRSADMLVDAIQNKRAYRLKFTYNNQTTIIS